jgi:hypothetical protein
MAGGMARTISKAAIERARRFVERAGRPLDRVLLDRAHPDALGRLVGELARFQTPEGGFGHGLEPDLRTPAPSAIATSVAFQYLRSVDAPGTLSMVKAGIDYLVRTVDRQAWVWPAVDARVSEGPHAPWWAPKLDRFRGYVFNPSAELLGYLYDYRTQAPDDVLNGVTSTVLRAVEAVEVIESAYELSCVMRLLHTKALPEFVRELLKPRLAASLAAADRDDAHFDLMGMVPTPSSFGYEIVRAGIARQAERLIASQADDGGWRPFWDAWNVEAHQEWRGVLTRQAIVGLSAHGFVAD